MLLWHCLYSLVHNKHPLIRPRHWSDPHHPENPKSCQSLVQVHGQRFHPKMVLTYMPLAAITPWHGHDKFRKVSHHCMVSSICGPTSLSGLVLIVVANEVGIKGVQNECMGCSYHFCRLPPGGRAVVGACPYQKCYSSSVGHACARGFVFLRVSSSLQLPVTNSSLV